jgi:lipopolysaccharide/colanic/teichoic acid biosynthesis glycosyltransferase
VTLLTDSTVRKLTPTYAATKRLLDVVVALEVYRLDVRYVSAPSMIADLRVLLHTDSAVLARTGAA